MEKHSEISLSGGGTTTLHVSPAKEPGAPVALVLPAMGVPAGYYGPFVDELASEGVTAAVADYPGQGEARPLTSRAHDHGYAEIAGGWLPSVVAALRADHDGPVVVIGHSLGGHIALAHLAGDEPVIDGVVLIGSGTPYWRHQQGVKTLVQTQAMGLITRALRFWPGDRLGFGGVQPRTLVREWAAFARTGTLAPEGRPVDDGLRQRELPVLVVDLDNDTLAPPTAVDGLVALLPAAQVERWAFTKTADDPGKPVNHYSFARSPEIIGGSIAEWALGHIVKRAGPPDQAR